MNKPLDRCHKCPIWKISPLFFFLSWWQLEVLDFPLLPVPLTMVTRTNREGDSWGHRHKKKNLSRLPTPSLQNFKNGFRCTLTIKTSKRDINKIKNPYTVYWYLSFIFLSWNVNSEDNFCINAWILHSQNLQSPHPQMSYWSDIKLNSRLWLSFIFNLLHTLYWSVKCWSQAQPGK